MDLAAGLASVNAAIETAKALRGIEKAYDQATIRAQMVGLIENLSDAKLALMDAREIIQARDAEIVALNLTLQKRDETVKSGGIYYKSNEVGEPTGDPLCTVCIERDGSQIPLTKAPGRNLLCTRCKWITEGVRSFP